MSSTQKLTTVIVTTAIMWLFVGLVVLIDVHVLANAVALILGLFMTLVVWVMWAMDHMGFDIDGTAQTAKLAPPEKAKRDEETSEDARLALLLSLLTPDERDALKTRLLGDLEGDGEMMPLSALLAEQNAASSEQD